MFVTLLDGREGGDDGCWIRKAREGTVARFPGSAPVTNRYSGRVRCPASRAEIVTQTAILPLDVVGMVLAIDLDEYANFGQMEEKED
jgi:hypothetical protein